MLCKKRDKKGKISIDCSEAWPNDARKRTPETESVMALDWKTTSQWWYGRFTENGRSRLINLNIKIVGRRPVSIHASGTEVDPEFTLSRGKALQKHDELREQIRSRENREEIQQKLLDLKTGSRLKSVKLVDLADAWIRIPRRRSPNLTYAAICQNKLRRFAAFVAEKWNNVDDLLALNRDHVAAFMETEAARGVSAKTWNDTLKLLRSTFRHLQPESDAFRYYLSTTPTRESETVFRHPFTPSELKAILVVAAKEDFVRPLIVTAMCTAMRRGDVCLLKWADVDLAGGFLTVKTAKTGQTVSIPIFPLLREELERRSKSGDFVFPEQAEMYRKNPSGITSRVQRVLAAALSSQPESGAKLLELPSAEVRTKAHAYLASLGETQRTRRMRAVFDAYLDGARGPALLATQGISKGSLSGYLNEIERAIGCRVIRGRHGARATQVGRERLRAERLHGQRRASVRDFHSFRVSWITLALTAGVPLELVRKVTGHKTADVVLKHYFQPGKEDLRQVLNAAMPQLMMNGVRSRDEQLREVIERMSPKTLRHDKMRALEILNGKP